VRFFCLCGLIFFAIFALVNRAWQQEWQSYACYGIAALWAIAYGTNREGGAR